MTAILGLDTILQDIQKSTDKQRDLEDEQNAYLSELTKFSDPSRTLAPSSIATYQVDIASIQSKLREVERKINLENAHYEELMLELSIKKKEVNKVNGTINREQHQSFDTSRKDEFNNNDKLKFSDDQSVARTYSDQEQQFFYGHPHQFPAKFPRFEETSDTSIDLNVVNDEMKLRNLENMYKRHDPIITYSGEETSGLESSFTSPSVHKDFIDQYLNKLSYLPGDVISNSEPAFSMAPPMQTTTTSLPMSTAFGLPAFHSTTIMDDFMTDTFNHVHEPSVDMLEIPGKGRCYVYFARYNYDPLQQSLNDNPETELYINKGDYILVWGETDEDGYLEGELLDGRKGLVPSNLTERLTGEDLLEFHQSCVLGVQEEDVWSTMVPSNLPMDYGAGETTSPPEEPMNYQYIEDDHLLNATYYSPDIEERHLLEHSSTNLGMMVHNESPTHLDTASSAVPAPRQLTLERQLNKSILIGWTPPDCPPGHIEMYHVYVDGFLRTTVRASDKTKALVEGVDSARPHRISVRSVTVNRKTSKDAACTMIIGKDAPLGPSCVRASNVTATSCVISWLPSNSNFQHTVCINNVEVRTVKPGVYKHTITGLTPNTTYKVTVRAKNIKASPFVDEKSLSRLLEKLSAHTEFRTLNKALPDPPMDVRVDGGPQDGTILVTWIPVTLNTAITATKQVPVTGYAVFADGKRVTDVDSPTSDHALVDLGCIGHFNPKLITVRSKSGDLLSNDSSAVPIVGSSRKRQLRGGDPRLRYGNGYRGTGIRSISKPRSLRGFRDASGQLVLDHDEENLSEKELYARNIPAIEITRDSAGSELEMYSDEDYDSGRGRMGRRHGGGYGMQARRRRQQGTRDGSRIFVALFDYDPPTMSPNPEACDEELPFREGQLIKIIGEKDADGFYWGECGNRSGYVPCNMVSEVQVDDERLVRDLLKEDRGRGGMGRQMGGAGPRDRWGDIYANAPVKKMIALYDYDPQELSPNVDAEVELAFRTGDVINVFGDMDDDGFYLAELRAQRGLVPSNFLTEAPNQDIGGRRGLGASGASGPPPPPRGGLAGKKAEPPKQEPKGGTTPLGGVGQTLTSLFSSKPKPPVEPEIKPPEPPKPTEINLDRIPGLDDDFFDEPKKPAVGVGGRLGAAAARPGAPGAAQPAPEQTGGLLGGLTSGLTSGMAGLAGGGVSGVTGKLGDIGGSAAGAAGGLLNSGKGLFKKFGF